MVEAFFVVVAKIAPYYTMACYAFFSWAYCAEGIARQQSGLLLPPNGLPF